MPNCALCIGKNCQLRSFCPFFFLNQRQDFRLRYKNHNNNCAGELTMRPKKSFFYECIVSFIRIRTNDFCLILLTNHPVSRECIEKVLFWDSVNVLLNNFNVLKIKCNTKGGAPNYDNLTTLCRSKYKEKNDFLSHSVSIFFVRIFF